MLAVAFTIAALPRFVDEAVRGRAEADQAAAAVSYVDWHQRRQLIRSAMAAWSEVGGVLPMVGGAAAAAAAAGPAEAGGVGMLAVAAAAGGRASLGAPP